MAYKPTPADIAINNHKPGDPPKIFFKDVKILDSTGRQPYIGNVLIEGERIAIVQSFSTQIPPDAIIIDGRGRKTLLSGLCDSHTHLSWSNAATLEELSSIGVEVCPILHFISRNSSARALRIYLKSYSSGMSLNPLDIQARLL